MISSLRRLTDSAVWLRAAGIWVAAATDETPIAAIWQASAIIYLTAAGMWCFAVAIWSTAANICQPTAAI